MKIKVKYANDIVFLVEASSDTPLSELILQLTRTCNGIIRIRNICSELEKLVNSIKVEAQCGTSGTAVASGDNLGPPNDARALLKVIAEAQARVSNYQQESGKCISESVITSTVDMLKGTVSVVDPFRMPELGRIVESQFSEHFEGELPETSAHLWWAGKELTRDKKLRDFVGSNEKTTIFATLGPTMPPTTNTQKDSAQTDFLLSQFRRHQEVQFLEASVESGPEADRRSLQKAFHGLGQVKWKP